MSLVARGNSTNLGKSEQSEEITLVLLFFCFCDVVDMMIPMTNSQNLAFIEDESHGHFCAIP